ncbi:MAG: histidine kinase [Bacteroidota bacterium]|nr:histidine kinase [Bacteroidota bacterium]
MKKVNEGGGISEHQQFIDAISASVPLIVFVFDMTARKFTFVNNKIFHTLGYEQEEFMNMGIAEFSQLVHPDHRNILMLLVGQRKSDAYKINHATIKILHKSGGYRIIQYRGARLKPDEKNDTQQILGTALDITEQKQYERQHNGVLRLQRMLKKNEHKIRTSLLLRGQEEERKRLASDMHEGIGQQLTALKMKLDTFEKNNRFISSETEESFSDISRILRQTIAEVRRISNDLVPIGLYDFGLSSVIRQLLETLTGKRLSFNSNIGSVRFLLSIEIAFYRICKETISNIRKHSQAQSVDVILYFKNNLLQMTIIDDGVGFVFNEQLPAKLRGKGNGLNNAHERTCIIGGKYYLETAPGKGCTSTLEVVTKPLMP